MSFTSKSEDLELEFYVVGNKNLIPLLDKAK